MAQEHRTRSVRTGPLAAGRGRYEGSWTQDLAARLKALDFINAIMLFGATLLLSALPLVILVSSLANERIDDDISRHIGLDNQGARIVHGLFRASPTHPVVPIVTGLVIAFAGTMAVVACLQAIYERAFDQEPRGWRDLPRFVVWVCVLLGAVIAEALLGGKVRGAVGPVVHAVIALAGLVVFFTWTMHFLLAGRVPWRLLVRPGFVTALFWLGLAGFSTLYFSSAVTSDTRLYGTIGVVFSLLTWFIAIGAVIVLGAACGAVWQDRSDRARQSPTASR
jgi:membrane protein